jgi:peptide-methionine (S)-S-oxide reductase
VHEVISGYAGGHLTNPSYSDICSGETGHAEIVRIGFDANEISYSDLLEVFFTIHDPTTPNRQGADIGSQYRSIILYQDENQQQQALDAIENAQKLWPNPIVTEVLPLGIWYPAEHYHQNYYAHNAHQPYCQVVVASKVAKVRRTFSERLLRSR